MKDQIQALCIGSMGVLATGPQDKSFFYYILICFKAQSVTSSWHYTQIQRLCHSMLFCIVATEYDWSWDEIQLFMH